MQNEIVQEIGAMITSLCEEHHRGFQGPVRMDLKLRDEIGLDSIDLVVLQINVEDCFNIRFDPLADNFLKIFDSVGTLCEYVDSKIGETDDR